MPVKKINVIILNTINFQDNDKIINAYSDKYGRIGIIALGVNKPTSKNSYSLSTFAFSELEIFKSRNINSLSKLKTGILTKSNIEISANYNNYLFASAIISIILQDNAYLGKNYRVFNMLKNCIENISKNSNPFSNMVWFLFFNLKNLGGEWNLNKCYICDQKNKIYRKFDFEKFGLVCANCFDAKNEKPQSSEFVNFLIKASKGDFYSMLHEPLNVSFEIILSKLLFTYLTNEIGIKSTPINEIMEKEIYNDQTFNEYTYSVLTKL